MVHFCAVCGQDVGGVDHRVHEKDIPVLKAAHITDPDHLKNIRAGVYICC